MKKSSVAPKAAFAAVFLIIAAVLSFFSFGVFFKSVTGGAVDFNNPKDAQMYEGVPVKGDFTEIMSCIGVGFDESNAEINEYYYYYVPFDSKKHIAMLVRAKYGSELCEDMNDLWRASSSGDTSAKVEISGVLRSMPTDKVDTNFEAYCDKMGMSDWTLQPYMLDCSTPVSTYKIVFIIAIAVYVLFFICVYMTIHAVKKNAEIEETQHRRDMMTASQNARNAEGDRDSDAMFGDRYSSAQSETQFRQGGQSQQNSTRPTQSQYKPTQQNQGGSYAEQYRQQDNAQFAQSQYRPTQQGQGGSYAEQYRQQDNAQFAQNQYRTAQQSNIDDDMFFGQSGGGYDSDDAMGMFGDKR